MVYLGQKGDMGKFIDRAVWIGREHERTNECVRMARLKQDLMSVVFKKIDPSNLAFDLDWERATNICVEMFNLYQAHANHRVYKDFVTSGLGWDYMCGMLKYAAMLWLDIKSQLYGDARFKRFQTYLTYYRIEHENEKKKGAK